MSKTHFWSGYIIQKCTFLSGLFLLAALVFCIKADTAPFLYPELRQYIQYSQSLSIVLLSTGWGGGLLLENGLRHRRQSG